MMSDTEMRLHLLSVAEFMVTCKKNNTHEWMYELVSRINEVCERTHDCSRVRYNMRQGTIDIFKDEVI